MAGASLDPVTNRGQVEPELIEGGKVEPLEEYPLEEKRHRAATARVLAYVLVGILGATILVQYGLTAWLVIAGRENGLAALDKQFNVLLPVLSGLVSGAVTFYFTKEKA